jgi:hypothetical protein
MLVLSVVMCFFVAPLHHYDDVFMLVQLERSVVMLQDRCWSELLRDMASVGMFTTVPPAK